LRLAAPDASKPKVSKSIPFDVAEDAWRNYREQTVVDEGYIVDTHFEAL
jgi:hypothetical protein